jgi:hypothetical protein
MPLDDTGFRKHGEPLDKIDRVIDLLVTEDRWCQGHLVTRDGRRCIMGAITAVGGTDVLVRPVMLAIRQVTERDFDRIERFNDAQTTTHALVLTVLYQARENILNGIVEEYSTTNWRQRLRQRLFDLLFAS